MQIDGEAPDVSSGLDPRYRRCSMWLDLLPGSLEPRPSLPASTDVDVAIVGSGFTGLWTAYYLSKADRSLRIAILEREIAGFGASGRNGGWVSPFFPTSLEKIAASHGRTAAVLMQRALLDTVDEISRICKEEGIDARSRKGGVLTLVTGPAQLARVRGQVDYYQSWGVGQEEIRWLDADGVRQRLVVAGCLGANYLSQCACIDPARLVRSLAQVVERMGAAIYERTPVLSIGSGRVTTPPRRGPGSGRGTRH
jgi:glycine/D-amino acid oxidase-like deaminating enzyme